MFSAEYVELLSAGPFPGRVDPWAEYPRYFQQIYANMIGVLMDTLRVPLYTLSYVAGRAVSLQIAERREPDVAVLDQRADPKPVQQWDYPGAAKAVLASPGMALVSEARRLAAIDVKRFDADELVTIIEISSPGNKHHVTLSKDHSERRERLVAVQQVSVVEFDLTRSVNHLIESPLVDSYLYHIAVFLPDADPRLIGMDFGRPLARVALPLRGEVVPVETQIVYASAYRAAMVAGQMRRDNFYTKRNLPFPSLMTPDQRGEALEMVARWQTELEQLGQRHVEPGAGTDEERG